VRDLAPGRRNGRVKLEGNTGAGGAALDGKRPSTIVKAGVMRDTGRLERTVTGTPQGGIASPTLANIALSALDRQYEADWQGMSRYQGRRQFLQRTGAVTYRMVRYADDLALLARGTREQAQALLSSSQRALRRSA
jgi:RNA-directed DNA polymerase